MPAIPSSILKRDAALRTAYGFGLFPLPPCREARIGDWQVVGHRPAVASGYLPGRAIERRHVLYHGGTAWMSNGLMEQESHLHHVHQARGLVVVAGLGLGMYAFAAARRPEVERVVVVERERDVIALMRQATRFDAWPERDKVTLVEADALDPDLADRLAEATDGRSPDYLYADIWLRFPDPDAPAQTAALTRRLRPAAAGWWGQEISFGLWCRAQGRAPDEDALRAFARSVGVPIPVTAGYASFCRDAIAAQLGPEAHGSWWRRVLAALRRAAAGGDR